MPNYQQGPFLARQGADGATGHAVWSNPNNVTIDDGASFASTVMSHANGFGNTNFLKITNFGFTIPVAATPLGLQFSIKRYWTSQFGITQAPTDQQVSTLPTSSANRGNGAWPKNTLRQISYGGASDLWGLAGLTAATINAATFGFFVQALWTAQSNFDAVTLNADAAYATVFYQLQGGSGGGAGGPSNGGVTAFQRIALFPMALNFFAFDPSQGFNDLVDGSSYSWRVEELLVGRKPTVSRLFVTYRDLGQVTATFTLTACQDDQTIVTNSATATLGNVAPTNALLTKEVDLMLSGMNMQLSVSRLAGAGPLSIAKVKVCGRVETDSYN